MVNKLFKKTTKNPGKLPYLCNPSKEVATKKENFILVIGFWQEDKKRSRKQCFSRSS
jgi:hypothetical protein